MSQVSRDDIKAATGGQQNPIAPGSIIYSSDIINIIDSAKWHDEGLQRVVLDKTNSTVTWEMSDGTKTVAAWNEATNTGGFTSVELGVLPNSDSLIFKHDGKEVQTFRLPSTQFVNVKATDTSTYTDITFTKRSGATQSITVLKQGVKDIVLNDNGILTVTYNDNTPSKDIALGGDITGVSYNKTTHVLTVTHRDGTSTPIDLGNNITNASFDADASTLTFTWFNGTTQSFDLNIPKYYLKGITQDPQTGDITFTKQDDTTEKLILPPSVGNIEFTDGNLVLTYTNGSTKNVPIGAVKDFKLVNGVTPDPDKLQLTLADGTVKEVELPTDYVTHVGYETITSTGDGSKIGRIYVNRRDNATSKWYDIPLSDNVYDQDWFSGAEAVPAAAGIQDTFFDKVLRNSRADWTGGLGALSSTPVVLLEGQGVNAKMLVGFQDNVDLSNIPAPPLPTVAVPVGGSAKYTVNTSQYTFEQDGNKTTSTFPNAEIVTLTQPRKVLREGVGTDTGIRFKNTVVWVTNAIQILGSGWLAVVRGVAVPTEGGAQGVTYNRVYYFYDLTNKGTMLQAGFYSFWPKVYRSTANYQKVESPTLMRTAYRTIEGQVA